MFEVNNDLNHLVWNHHNQFHVLATFIMTVVGPWWGGYAVMLAWEIGDGFKPWWYDFEPTGHKVRDFFVANFLYSDKFSLQDVLVWNMSGFVSGVIAKLIFGGL